MNLTTIHIPFDEVLLPARNLRFGRFKCMYEHGRIRYVALGEIELIRMVYFAVRDKDWNTPPYTIENELIETHNNGFTISYTALHSLDDISYRSQVSIRAVSDTITFFVRGEALSNFQRNRIGICVLHPIKESRGKDVLIERPDGTQYRSSFPDLISPHQPFKDIKKMQYAVSHDISVEIDFEGDVFETEDQRNWSDSSFKTYSTPLSIPFPVNVKQGDTIEQKVELKLTGHEAKFDNSFSVPNERRFPFPKLGYSPAVDELSDDEIILLSKIPFDHYRVELSLKDPGWKEILVSRMNEVIKLNASLELILVFDEHDKHELKNFIAAIKQNSSIITSMLILDPGHAATTEDHMEFAFAQLKHEYPAIEIGYGTNGFFADLNRSRPPIEASFDFVSFSLCPQVHATDTRSLFENLQQQNHAIQTARSFAPGKKIHISPITFKIRSLSKDAAGLPRDYDPRQHHNAGAWWTLCTLRNLAEADQLSFYAAKGYRGLLYHAPGGSSRSPLYKVLEELKRFMPRWVIRESESMEVSEKVVFENEAGDRLEFVLDNANLLQQ